MKKSKKESKLDEAKRTRFTAKWFCLHLLSMYLLVLFYVVPMHMTLFAWMLVPILAVVFGNLFTSIVFCGLLYENGERAKKGLIVSHVVTWSMLFIWMIDNKLDHQAVMIAGASMIGGTFLFTWLLMGYDELRKAMKGNG